MKELEVPVLTSVGYRLFSSAPPRRNRFSCYAFRPGH